MWSRVDRERVDREERARDRRERRREAVHVVEQVERVRHPEQPDDAERGRERRRSRRSRTRTPDHDDERGGAALRGELRERRQAEDVVDEAGDEEDRAAAEDAAELPARGNDARVATAIPDATSSPAKIPLPPSSGVERVCQRSARGAATTWRAAGVCRRPQIVEQARGQGGKGGRGDRHGEKANHALLSGCLGSRPVVWPASQTWKPASSRSFVARSAGPPSPRTRRGLTCSGCGRTFGVQDGIPLMLHEDLPGAREKLGEAAGWVEKAQAEGWYEPDDKVDAVLPFVNRELGWNDLEWLANGHSFQVLLDRYVGDQRGLRVLEVGAAKAWASRFWLERDCEYVATDILVDPKIGLGRGAFYGDFGRVQADGEHLPFADETFDVVVLRRDAAPRARPAADGAGDGARDAAGRRSSPG